MCKPSESNQKIQKYLIYTLFIGYLLYPIFEIYYVTVPNSSFENSLNEYIEYFRKNITNSSEDNEIKNLKNTKEHFHIPYLCNAIASFALPIIDFIIIIFYCCGKSAGEKASADFCRWDFIKCFIKYAIKSPLFTVSLAGFVIFITIIFFISDYQEAKSAIKKLKKKLNIEKVNINIESNQLYNALFLVLIFILIISSIVYYCLNKCSGCCCCCYCCCNNSCLPNPPKIEIKITKNEIKDNNLKEKYKYLSIKKK